MKKLMGSGITSYFDGIIITAEYKFLLDIDYTNGIFIDDDPRDLNGLYAAFGRVIEGMDIIDSIVSGYLSIS